MQRFRTLTLLAFLVFIALLISACGGTTTTPAPPAATTSGKTPDWSMMGFTTVLNSMELPPGQQSTATAGPYTFQVPVGSFTDPVKFEVLSQSASVCNGKVPVGTKPVLAFALKVTDENTGQLIASFKKPILMMARDPGITAQSMYYNISASGMITPNPAGMKAMAGELDHPVTGAVFAWVITSPAGGAGTGTASISTTSTGGSSTPGSSYGY